jgi:hypothetical protein
VVRLTRLPAIFQGVDERFPLLAETEAILPVHIVGMELNLNRLPDDAIPVPGFGGEDGGVLSTHYTASYPRRRYSSKPLL